MLFRIVGPGRAGGSFASALSDSGWSLDGIYGRSDDLSGAAIGVDLVLLCVPDRAISAVADAIEPGDAAIVHVAGSQQLTVLGAHRRRASIHPLMALPDPITGARRLIDNCPFAVAGDQISEDIANVLGGWTFKVPEKKRMLYHAAATVASNHLVALIGQVERIAAEADVPSAAFGPLMLASLNNALDSDAATALTGPAARGDWETVRGHLDALDDGAEAERRLYLALADEAAALAARELPQDLLP